VALGGGWGGAGFRGLQVWGKTFPSKVMGGASSTWGCGGKNPFFPLRIKQGRFKSGGKTPPPLWGGRVRLGGAKKNHTLHLFLHFVGDSSPARLGGGENRRSALGRSLPALLLPGGGGTVVFLAPNFFPKPSFLGVSRGWQEGGFFFFAFVWLVSTRAWFRGSPPMTAGFGGPYFFPFFGGKKGFTRRQWGLRAAKFSFPTTGLLFPWLLR